MKIHDSITNERIIDELHRSGCLDSPGVCLTCGEDADGVEPDAEGYECEACGAHSVCGWEQLLIMGGA